MADVTGSFQELRRLLREAEPLKARIRLCAHEWIYGARTPATINVRVSAHPLDGPEWDTYEARYGYQQQRCCSRCGLAQWRDEAGPGKAGPWRCDVPEFSEGKGNG
jgi:hypothetical protein